MKGRRKDRLPLDGFKAGNPEYQLVARANLIERLVSKQRRMKSELIENDAPREQVKVVDERITKLGRTQSAGERVTPRGSIGQTPAQDQPFPIVIPT
ncbi:MAG: hypothetical protein ABI865_12145 [Nitrosospira sp.]